MYFYQRLKDLRKDKDMTQEQVAKILGKQEIPFHHVITLAKFYNVSIDYIAGLSQTPNELF